MPNATVRAAAIGLPGIDPAALVFPREKLALLSMADLAVFSQIIGSMQSLLANSAVMSGGRGDAAAEMLEDLSGILISALSDITRVAREHRPADLDEANWRAWTLINHATVFSEDIADIAADAALLAADQRSPFRRQ